MNISHNLENYVILPGRNHDDYEYPDILVGTKLEKVNSWGKAQLKVGEKNHFLPTIRQYLDFWIMLGEANKIYLGNGKKAKKEDLDRIRSEFLGSGYKVEALDARFTTSYENETHMLFDHRLKNGVLLPNQIVKVDFSPFRGYSYGHELKKFDKHGILTRGGIYPGDSWVKYCAYNFKTNSLEGIHVHVPSPGFCGAKILAESKSVATIQNSDSGCTGLTLDYSSNIDSKNDEFLFARPCRLKEK